MAHLKGLSSLSRLSLKSTQFKNDDLPVLVPLRNLLEVSLDRTQVTVDGIREHIRAFSPDIMFYLEGNGSWIRYTRSNFESPPSNTNASTGATSVQKPAEGKPDVPPGNASPPAGNRP
jgi:hypothetical protein